MILADKIIKQRKKNGWSQEELAYKMNVSRQAVSKWESAQTIPDIDKIMQLGELFGVTIDYLLKDSIEDEEFTDTVDEAPVKKVSLDEANTYLATQKKNSWMTAIATLLCILSPVVLIVLSGLSAYTQYGITENVATIVGLVLLFAFVVTAVPMFKICDNRNKPYGFLDKTEPFDLEYGVKGILQERQKQVEQALSKWSIVAVIMSILSPIPVIVGCLVDPNSIIGPALLAVTLAITSLSACIWIIISMQKEGYNKLLRVEEYTDKGKKRRTLRQPVSVAYWGLFTVAYLIWSLVAEAWDISWVLWLASGILYPIVVVICNHIADKQIEKENKNK